MKIYVLFSIYLNRVPSDKILVGVYEDPGLVENVKDFMGREDHEFEVIETEVITIPFPASFLK